MTNDNENPKSKEQTINKKLVPDDFYRQLKVILDKDEFDIFKTKVKKKLETRIRLSDSKIQRLLDLKARSTKSIKESAIKKKQFKTENLKLKESVVKQLDLEVA